MIVERETGESEPTTADWLRSIGFYEDHTGCYLILEDDFGWQLAFLLEESEPGVVIADGSASWRGDDMLETCKVSTRGHVLRLCEALGVVLPNPPVRTAVNYRAALLALIDSAVELEKFLPVSFVVGTIYADSINKFRDQIRAATAATGGEG